tara:strand:+ start:11743 stop:12486 length:744 start_codon:yes stop_codon:yes gene_type:complete
MTEHVRLELTDRILSIFLNRPDKKNALTQEMYTVLANAFNKATNDHSIKSVLITGGNNFSAGNDLNDFLKNPTEILTSPLGDFIQALASCTKPVVAAVDGFAVGIGTTMLLHCDLVYCTDRTTFILPFVNLGLVPEFGSTLLLPNLAGNQLAAELLMLGEPFNAEKAQRAGLINGVCEPEQLLKNAKIIAEKLAAKPAKALQQTKMLLRQVIEPLNERITREANLFHERLCSDEAVTAMQAIIEKRQ